MTTTHEFLRISRTKYLALDDDDDEERTRRAQKERKQ